MLIIANLYALGLSDGTQTQYISELLKQEGRDFVVRDIYKSVALQYNDQSERRDVCLYNPSAEELSKNVVLGIDYPNTVIEAATQWNAKIQKMALDAIKGALPELEQKILDTQKTYALSCAARMADNHWFWTSDFATYIDRKDVSYPFFKVLLKEEDVKDITAHPEQYVLITVHPK